MKPYIAAEMQIERFDQMDVITASSESSGIEEETEYFDYTTPWA